MYFNPARTLHIQKQAAYACMCCWMGNKRHGHPETVCTHFDSEAVAVCAEPNLES